MFSLERASIFWMVTEVPLPGGGDGWGDGEGEGEGVGVGPLPGSLLKENAAEALTRDRNR
jgi:hypothetical protein